MSRRFSAALRFVSDSALLRSFASIGIFLAATPYSRAEVPQTIVFNTQVRPILSDKCFACHGFDQQNRKAELRLDRAEDAYADRDGVKAIAPGDLAASEFWTRISSTDESVVMPPPESHKTLSSEEISILKRWIEQGALYQKHWAFEPPVEHSLPEVQIVDRRIENPIDAFIVKRLQREGLTLSPEADKETLIRRIAFALTGLPPTAAEVDAYLADSAANAYEAMVDRYLASQHYGEEMARHWLDVARYADTHGLHLDNERQMWAYRDWVIAAFNRNLSFDRFTIDQLAGDLLPSPSQEQLIATGFNRCNVTTSEGGAIDDEYIFRYAVDRTSTTMQAWMGLTGGCAACHDHKFDPIKQREFYSFYAFFHSAADPAMDRNAKLTEPVIKLESPELQAKINDIEHQIEAKQNQLDEQAIAIQYTDPALLSPPSAAVELESVWMDDDFPAGGNATSGPGHPTTFVTAEDGQVLSGKRALKRSDNTLSQDVWDQATTPLEVPQGGRFFAYVWIDPANPPKALMLQFHKAGWQHRAVWGDYDAINWGAANTTERVLIGPLPNPGEWVRLEVPIEKIGLAPGDMLTGFAITQSDGTVFWDKIGVAGVSQPATDPLRSFLAWWKHATGKDTPGIAPDLNQVAKEGPERETKSEDLQRLRSYYLQNVCADTKVQFKAINGQIKKLQDKRSAVEKKIPGTFIYKDLSTPRDSFVMLRGAYDKPGEKVLPDVPAVLPPLKKADPEARATRLDMANWLVSPEHPLTARVTVNRYWQQFFGTGLVKTSFDFGTQGEIPTHPELLDWLAIHFRNNGWDTKSLVKMLVMSATFRQSSAVTPALHGQDPENRLYARGPRFRLDAEQIRDNALYVSGLGNLELGGKGVNTYQPPNIWEPVGFVGSNTRHYKQDHGTDLYRRSIYSFFKRTAPPPFMVNFDAPNREQFCARRERSNTPLQALQLMNDVQHVEAARAFAQRMLTEGGASPTERIQFAYRVVLSRTPDETELAVVNGELAAHLARYQQDVEAAKQLISHGESKPNAALEVAELAAYTMVANMILNLDETLTRN